MFALYLYMYVNIIRFLVLLTFADNEETKNHFLITMENCSFLKFMLLFTHHQTFASF